MIDTIATVAEDVIQLEPPYAEEGVQNDVTTLGNNLFLKEINIELLYDPTILFLGVPKRIENLCPHKNSPIATLFLIAKKWKQPKCLSTDKSINKISYSSILDYYSVIKKENEVWIHGQHW